MVAAATLAGTALAATLTPQAESSELFPVVKTLSQPLSALVQSLLIGALSSVGVGVLSALVSLISRKGNRDWVVGAGLVLALLSALIVLMTSGSLLWRAWAAASTGLCLGSAEWATFRFGPARARVGLASGFAAVAIIWAFWPVGLGLALLLGVVAALPALIAVLDIDRIRTAARRLEVLAHVMRAGLVLGLAGEVGRVVTEDSSPTSPIWQPRVPFIGLATVVNVGECPVAVRANRVGMRQWAVRVPVGAEAHAGGTFTAIWITRTGTGRMRCVYRLMRSY